MRTIRWFHAALVVALGLCAQAWAQNSVHQNVALTPTGTPARFAKVLVCNYPANATPCTNLATIYSDQTTSHPIPNPLTTDQFGNYNFWAPQNFYAFQLQQNGQPGVYKAYVDILPNDPNNPTFTTETLTGAITQANQAATKLYVDTHGGGGGANLPAVTQAISGDGTGNGVAMPEKPTTLVTGTPNTATVQCDEDWSNGRFDPRCTKYAGGVYGATTGAAMQAFSDALICYQATTRKHAKVIFPPMFIAVGTPANPTLKLPTGAIYEGGGGWGFGSMATTFQSTYNNVGNVEFDAGLKPSAGSSCIATLTSVANQSGGLTTYTGTIPGGASNGLVGSTFTVSGFTISNNNGTYTVSASTATTLQLHNATGNTETHAATAIPTSTMGGGSYDGIAQHGCGQGGCVTVPADGGNYPFGGPLQTGIAINDLDGPTGAKAGVFAANNGADGVLCNGQDSHCHEIGGSSNNEYFYFGIDTAGQNYQFSNGECHADVTLGGLDNMNPGPFETYGTFITPGWEYGHIGGICWGGGLTNLGHYFSQIEEIGVIHLAGGNTQASADSGRIDAARGDGILDQGNGLTTWTNPRVISACRFDGANDYVVFSVGTATAGSGQTPGTYLLNASSGSAQISVTVGGGGTVTAVAVTVHGRAYTSTPPTFTLAAGGTPATFTVNMASIFSLLHRAGGPPFTACSYIAEQSSGNDTYLAPLMVNNGFFGADHSTGDVVTPVVANTWVAPIGNAANGDIKWDPNPALTGSFWPGGAQRIIRADPSLVSGGIGVVGSVIPVGTSGAHIKMANSSFVTLTAVTGATIAEDLWITGDGFTTMPFTLGNDSSFFGAVTCSTQDTLLNAGQLYHFVVQSGLNVGNPVNLVEQCESTFTNYLWANHVPTAGSLPPLAQQGTVDSMGDIRSHAIPALAALTIQAGGTPGANGVGGSYSYSYRVWGPWGTQTYGTATLVTQCLPLPGFINNPCFQTVHWNNPEGTTHIQLFRETSTDGVATPGMIFEQTFTSPQHTSAQGFPDTRIAPINSNIIGSANWNANMTGGPWECATLPPGPSYPSVQGQQCQDLAGGVLWTSPAPDTWRAWTIGSASAADAEIPTGVIDGTNVTYTLNNSPTPAASLRLYRNGLRQISPDDYTITGNTITYQNPPSPGDTHVADYRF